MYDIASHVLNPIVRSNASFFALKGFFHFTAFSESLRFLKGLCTSMDNVYLDVIQKNEIESILPPISILLSHPFFCTKFVEEGIACGWPVVCHHLKKPGGWIWLLLVASFFAYNLSGIL